MLRNYIAALILLVTLSASAETERYYQELWCKGEVEVILEDNSRVDCLTSVEAVEVDFARKWAESIGQSLLYARLTGKAPAVLLIVDDKSAKYLARFHNATQNIPIKLYVIEE